MRSRTAWTGFGALVALVVGGGALLGIFFVAIDHGFRVEIGEGIFLGKLELDEHRSGCSKGRTSKSRS